MAGNGYVGCAVATLVAFDGLLRVAELVAVMVADVSLPGRQHTWRRITYSVAFSGFFVLSIPSSFERRLHSSGCY